MLRHCANCFPSFRTLSVRLHLAISVLAARSAVTRKTRTCVDQALCSIQTIYPDSPTSAWRNKSGCTFLVLPYLQSCKPSLARHTRTLVISLSPAMRETRCCGVLSLRAGTIAIGCYQAIVGVVVLTVCVYLLVEDINTPTIQMVYRHRKIAGIPKQVVCILGAIFASIKLLMAIPLVYGGYKKKPRYLYMWMVYAAICASVKMVAMYFILKMTAKTIMMLGIGGTVLIGSFMLLHFLKVVYNYEESLEVEINGKNGQEEYEDKVALV